MANDVPMLNIITPRGVAIFPRLNTPDTKYVPEGQYSAKVSIVPSDEQDGMVGRQPASLAELIAALEGVRDEFAEKQRKTLAASADPKAKAKAKTLKVADIGEEGLDDEGNPNGQVILKAKMKASGTSAKGPWTRKPVLFDAANKKIPDGAPAVYGGSVLKLAAQARPYYSAKDNVVGVTLYLEAAQVIELVSAGGGRSAAAYGFGATDGYTSDDADGTPFADDSGGDDTANF